jgi:hypothetical protein
VPSRQKKRLTKAARAEAATGGASPVRPLKKGRALPEGWRGRFGRKLHRGANLESKTRGSAYATAIFKPNAAISCVTDVIILGEYRERRANIHGGESMNCAKSSSIQSLHCPLSPQSWLLGP